MRRDGGSVFPAHANTGDPNGPNRGLSANENERALLSMMARSKCSNQRPDTLMQDRSPPARRNHLQRTAGPYIGSKAVQALSLAFWLGATFGFGTTEGASQT